MVQKKSNMEVSHGFLLLNKQSTFW